MSKQVHIAEGKSIWISPYIEEEIVRILGGEFSKNRGDALAGSAPGGSKVDDDQYITRFSQFPQE